jgi:methionine sulfoxide reductase heme-binding subunit
MAKRRRWSKVPVFLLGLAPLFWLGWRAWNDQLTANPIEFITHYTGDWTLRLILIGLAVTPFRKSLHLPNLIHYRRMIGLFAFFYACLHFTIYVLDQVFNVQGIVEDIVKRPYITVGFTSFVLLIPLAITSTAGWIRRLGGRRWALLHRAVYLTAIGGVIHYYWLVKSDIRLPVFYGILATLLLGWRLQAWMRSSSRRVAPPPPPPHEPLRKSPQAVAQ